MLLVQERERTGIQSLKVGFNRVFGYYIEVTKANLDKVPPEYVRKQTIANGERFITPEMKEYETLVLNAEERIREIELRLFKEICAAIAKSAFKLLETARALAQRGSRVVLACRSLAKAEAELKRLASRKRKKLCFPESYATAIRIVKLAA